MCIAYLTLGATGKNFARYNKITTFLFKAISARFTYIVPQPTYISHIQVLLFFFYLNILHFPYNSSKLKLDMLSLAMVLLANLSPCQILVADVLESAP